MSLVIVAEGPDGGGKTTLCRWLEQNRGFRYQHEGPPPPGINLIDYYSQKLWTALSSKTPVVLDRLHIGEMIYGSIARHQDRVGYYGMKLFQRVFASQNALCLICLPDFVTCHENWKKKFVAANDYLQDESKFADCYHRYRGLSMYRHHQLFDYTAFKSMEENFSWWEMEPNLRTPVFPDGVIGSREARFLIVGEQVNSTSMDLPFFSDHGSSRFLNDSLWAAGFKEEEMMFTNAKTYKGKLRDLRLTVEQLPQLQAVIALGNEALQGVYRVLSIKDQRVSGLPHPAYFKRFHHSKGQEYIRQLREIRESVR